MKDFIGWFKLKVKTDVSNLFHYPKEKEIWWCRVGVNVGSEIYGKGSEYSRPVLVINAEVSDSFIGIPLTSNLKK